MIACLRKHSKIDFQNFSDVPIAEQMIEGIKTSQGPYSLDQKISELVENYKSETARIIQTALNKNNVVRRGKFPLESLNVWDARWNGRYARSNHFVSYKDGDETEVLHGDFVVEIDKDYNVLAVYDQ